MTKRYREPLEDIECDGDVPTAFAWRGQRYRVSQVLGHWREDPGWWRCSDGVPVRIEQADLWRVEAGPGSHGVYELVRQGAAWRLDRVWD